MALHVKSFTFHLKYMGHRSKSIILSITSSNWNHNAVCRNIKTFLELQISMAFRNFIMTGKIDDDWLRYLLGRWESCIEFWSINIQVMKRWHFWFRENMIYNFHLCGHWPYLNICSDLCDTCMEKSTSLTRTQFCSLPLFRDLGFSEEFIHGLLKVGRDRDMDTQTISSIYYTVRFHATLMQPWSKFLGKKAAVTEICRL